MGSPDQPFGKRSPDIQAQRAGFGSETLIGISSVGS